MNKQEIRAIERVSIRDFLLNHREYLWGRVLDFGSGQAPHRVQPYRYIVEAEQKLHGGEYFPFDKGDAMPEGRFDCVLMTQVLQYLPDPLACLQDLQRRTTYLVMTYPTHWEEVEREDLWRFTKHGMQALLERAGFTVREHQLRWSLPFEDFKLAGGYGVIAENVGT